MKRGTNDRSAGEYCVVLKRAKAGLTPKQVAARLNRKEGVCISADRAKESLNILASLNVIEKLDGLYYGKS